MTDIPKIVYGRLRVPPKDGALAGSHPDLELLAAFTEQALAGPHRESVLGHLALCGQCREIVALAMPAAEIFDGQPHTQERPGQSAVREKPVREEAVREEDQQASIPITTKRNRWFGFARPNLAWAALAAGVAAVASMLVLHPLQQKQVTLTASNQRVAATLPRAADSQSAAQWQPSAEVVRRKEPPPIGSSSRNERSNSGAAAMVADNRYPREEALIARKPASPIEKAKPALSYDETQLASADAAAAFKWKISAGVLERSFDNGRSWQIGLRADHPLLCYASRGSDIWVGGQAGTLLHSNDNGITWAPVRVGHDGGTASSDVTRIDLQSAHAANGSNALTAIVVSTGSGEVWDSADGGNTWNKQ
jgi:hypothetical protein